MRNEASRRIRAPRHGVALAVLACTAAWAAPAPGPGAVVDANVASARERPPDGLAASHASLSESARTLAEWAVRARDAAGRPFLIVDKRRARLHVFDADGSMRASAPVLLGSARGDDSVPGIGERAIEEIRPHERTTPAGRFVAERGVNLHGEDVVWIDYDAAVSMHRVRTTNARERRLERLRTSRIDDNRISYGCINVPARFYDLHVTPVFGAGRAVVYVLPETRSAREQFGLREPAPHDQRPDRPPV